MRVASCPQHFIDFANGLANAVGVVHRRYFRNKPLIEYKADHSPVTQADRESEELARELIMQAYPEHGIIGEEFPPHQADADFVWIIDPIDGTKLFLTGKPTFALLLALAHNGQFILGLTDHAVLGERWLGADGHGTRCNGEKVRSRQCAHLSDAILCRPGYEDHTMGRDSLIDAVESKVQWAQWGISPYDYGLVASGFLDLLVNAGPKLHDLAAVDPIVRNAGGKVTDWFGNRLNIRSPDHIIVAGDAALIDQAVPLLAG